MNKLSDTIGKICEVLLPIREEFYFGNSNSSICICTLSDIKLLKEIKNSKIIDNVAVVGRLFTENKGIDSIIKYVNQNKKIKTIIVCGKDVWGHKSGHSLFELYKNGVDNNDRIINSISPDPFLTVSKLEIEYFQKQINLVNLINETNIELINNKIKMN